MPRRRPLALLLSLALPGCESEPPLPATVDGAPLAGTSLDIVVDLRDPASGKARVVERFHGLGEDIRLFKTMGKDPEYRYSDLVVTVDGQPVAAELQGKKLELSRDAEGDVEVRYTVQPGGDGRHGHQGMVAEDFALFDGRLFVLPNRATELEAARVRFELPEGWTVASPLREEDGWYHYDVFGPDNVADVVASACLGAGPFEATTRTIGGTEFRVFSHGSWTPEHKAALADKSMRIFDWFHRELGFDLGAPYAVVWSPKVDSSRLFGGSHANGTCFEHPQDRLRNWELLSHRVGHSMNKYNPVGMHLRDGRDHWFKEGFASYVEVVATVETGAAKDAAAWNDLLSKHRARIAAHPEWDVPLAAEPTVKGDQMEYFHYTKGPVVVRLLDQAVRERSDTTLIAFMKAMWAKYGRYQGAFPLREELEAFTGASFDDFWALYVDAPGALYPVWEEAFRPRPAGTAATATGQAVSGEYLHLLAASGDFERFADVRDFVAEEPLVRARLAARGVYLLPEGLRGREAELSAVDRAGLVRAEREASLLLAPPGTAPPAEAPPLPTPDFVPDTEDPDGRAFATLLADEAAFEASLGRSGLTGVALREGGGDDDRDQLAVSRHKDVTFHAWWRVAPGRLTTEVWQGEEREALRQLDMEPGWTHSRSTLAPRDRSGRDPVLRVRLLEGDRVLGERSFWQR